MNTPTQTTVEEPKSWDEQFVSYGGAFASAMSDGAEAFAKKYQAWVDINAGKVMSETDKIYLFVEAQGQALEKLASKIEIWRLAALDSGNAGMVDILTRVRDETQQQADRMLSATTDKIAEFHAFVDNANAAILKANDYLTVAGSKVVKLAGPIIDGAQMIAGALEYAQTGKSEAWVEACAGVVMSVVTAAVSGLLATALGMTTPWVSLIIGLGAGIGSFFGADWFKEFQAYILANPTFIEYADKAFGTLDQLLYPPANLLASHLGGSLEGRKALDKLSYLPVFALEAGDDTKYELYDPITGKGNITQQWIEDKALAVVMLQYGLTHGGVDWLRTHIIPYLGLSGDIEINDLANRVDLIINGLDFGIVDKAVIKFGGDSVDVLEGGTKEDHLYGGKGADVLNGNAGDDYIEGGDGDDVLHGNADSDTLLGMSGNDLLFGDEGNDSLDGGADNDKLDGGAGHDTLVGGTGDDTLTGGKGNDALMGGKGADTYIFKTADGGFGADSIWDEDGNGTIIIDNQPITGTPKQINDHLWQFDLPDGRRVMIVVINNGSDLIGTTAIYTTNIEALQIKIVRQFAIYN